MSTDNSVKGRPSPQSEPITPMGETEAKTVHEGHGHVSMPDGSANPVSNTIARGTHQSSVAHGTDLLSLTRLDRSFHETKIEGVVSKSPPPLAADILGLAGLHLLHQDVKIDYKMGSEELRIPLKGYFDSSSAFSIGNVKMRTQVSNPEAAKMKEFITRFMATYGESATVAAGRHTDEGEFEALDPEILQDQSKLEEAIDLGHLEELFMAPPPPEDPEEAPVPAMMFVTERKFEKVGAEGVAQLAQAHAAAHNLPPDAPVNVAVLTTEQFKEVATHTLTLVSQVKSQAAQSAQPQPELGGAPSTASKQGPSTASIAIERREKEEVSTGTQVSSPTTSEDAKRKFVALSEEKAISDAKKKQDEAQAVAREERLKKREDEKQDHRLGKD